MNELSHTTDEKRTKMELRPHTVAEWVSAICRNLNYLALAPDCPVEKFSDGDWRRIVYGNQNFQVYFYGNLYKKAQEATSGRNF